MDTVGTQKKILYIAKSNSTYRNLAMEEYFIDYIERETQQNNSVIALFLWQSDNTIVIGKHQNAQRECNLEFVRQNNLKIARRKTGGGAVFHDSGNLNFSIIASKNLYNQENNFLMIIKALKKLGLNAVLSGRNDILIDNKASSYASVGQSRCACIAIKLALGNNNCKHLLSSFAMLFIFYISQSLT